MLPDFVLPVTIDGEPRGVVLCRDVPTCVFFADFAESFPGAPCFAAQGQPERVRTIQQMGAWSVRLLPRVIVYPAVEVADMLRLGDGWDALARAYLCAVNFLDNPAERERVPAAVVWAGSPVAEPAGRREAALLSAYPRTLSPNIQAVMKLLSSKLRVPPSVLWAMPISEWLLNYRVTLQPDLLDKLHAGASPGQVPDDLTAAGIEGA